MELAQKREDLVADEPARRARVRLVDPDGEPEPPAGPAVIGIEDFSKVELRSAKVISCERLIIFGLALAQIRLSRATFGPRFAWILEAGGYIVTGAAILAIAVLVALAGFSGPMRRRLLSALEFLPEHHHRRADRVVTAFLEGTACTKNRKSLLLLMSYTAGEWAVILLGIACLFWAYPATSQLGFRDALIFTGFVAFGGLVQIPGIGGGVQIVSILILNEFFSVPLEAATALAIVLWFVTLVVIVPIGLTFAFHEGLNWRQFRELEHEAVERAHAPQDEPAGGTNT
jgi:hypothetical protein